MPPVIYNADQIKFLRDTSKLIKHIKKDGQYNDWMKIGSALALGRQTVMLELGVNDTTSGKYRIAFSEWCKKWDQSGISKFDRSDLLFLQEAENRAEADNIRAGWSEQQRQRVSHPHAMVRYIRKKRKELQDEPKRKAKELLAAAADQDERDQAEPERDPWNMVAHLISTNTVIENTNLLFVHLDEDELRRIAESILERLSQQ